MVTVKQVLAVRRTCAVLCTQRTTRSDLGEQSLALRAQLDLLVELLSQLFDDRL